jgi:chemotaxis response regulator CheB
VKVLFVDDLGILRERLEDILSEIPKVEVNNQAKDSLELQSLSAK